LESEPKRILRAKKDLSEFDSLYREYFPKINNFVYHRVEDKAYIIRKYSSAENGSLMIVSEFNQRNKMYRTDASAVLNNGI
jgi:hypothetical protein